MAQPGPKNARGIERAGLLSRPYCPAASLRRRVCVLTSRLLAHSYDLDVCLALELLLRQLAVSKDTEVVVGLYGAHTGGEYAGIADPRLQTICSWIEGLGASVAALPFQADPSQASIFAHNWLLDNQFESVLAIDDASILYWALQAREFGLAHITTRFALLLHNPLLWEYEQRAEFVPDHVPFLNDWMARQVVARADGVWSFQRGMRRWLEARGWPVDRIEFLDAVWPAQKSTLRPCREGQPNKHLYFVGNLDARYGLKRFVAALECLTESDCRRLAGVHFRGIPGRMFPEHAANVIATAASSWSFPWTVDIEDVPERIFSQIDPESAVIVNCSPLTGGELLQAYAAAHGIVYVITCDTSAADRIDPLLAYEPNDARRTARLIHEALHPRNDLRLSEGILKGSASGARGRSGNAEDNHKPALHILDEPIIGNFRNSQRRSPPIALVRFILSDEGVWRSSEASPVSPSPLVSVIMVHYDRPDLLHQALHSLTLQDYDNFEIVLVDDASPSRRSKAYINRLHSEFDSLRWRLIVNDSEKWTGASRNQAIRDVTGEYVIIFDDDNVARPNMITTLVQAAERGKLDHVSCFSYTFSGSDFPSEALITERLLPNHAPPGPAVGIGLIRNIFCESTYLLRRSTFLEIGGYDTEYGVGHENYELGARIANSGKRSGIVPEVLYLNRWSGRNMMYRLDNIQIYKSVTRAIGSYYHRVEPGLHDMLRLTQHITAAKAQAAGEGYWALASLPAESAGHALRGKLSERQYHERVVDYCIESGRFETAAIYNLGQLKDPALKQAAESRINAILPKLSDGNLTVFRQELEQALIPPGSKADLLAAVARLAADRGETEELMAALHALEGLNTALPEVIAALSKHNLSLGASDMLAAFAARIAGNREHRGLLHLLLRSLRLAQDESHFSGPSGG